MERRGRSAISTTAAAIVIVILILAVAAGIYFYSTSSKTTTSSTSSTSTTSTSSTTGSSSSTTSGAVPSTLTYEAGETPEYLDPGVSYFSYDYNILQNVYEPLLWYNGSCSTCIIPWLAQNYTVSSNLEQYYFTLRPGITFADGEQFNSTAVYFSLDRLLVEDGSTPVAHGTQASWLLQQLLNTSLSTTLSGGQTYGSNYVQDVLAENFIQITGQYTFTLNVMHPTSAVPELLAGEWAVMLAPGYTMTQDLSTFKAAGYTLPYPTLSGNATQEIDQYFDDVSSTCNTGSTQDGCGTTYFDVSADGSMAGTGPYTIQSNDATTNVITLQANPTYWGGPLSTKINPQIKTIVFKYVADTTTREIDIQNAAKSGQAMAIDLPATNLYDIADRSDWINSNQLVSTISGISIYGTYPIYSTLFDPFGTNVTNALTGSYYKFQPFADIRFREAFSDAVNMTLENEAVNNNAGQVAINVVPPGLPPSGAYNDSITPTYSYNPDEVQNLLLSAMENPITSFNFENGTAAPSGFFDNSFGCTTLGSNNQCSNPVAQSIPLIVGSGDVVDEQIFNAIATTINNVSSTYNMGLTVSVVPVPTGTELANAFASPTHYYMYALGWIDDYPWVLDFLGPMYAPNGAYTGPDGWNLPAMETLYQQAQNDSATGNTAGLVAAADQMSVLANKEVMYLWTIYTVNYVTMTSNVQGFYFNPGLSTAAGGGVGPEYFATLY